MDKINLDLNEAVKTLILPLFGRAEISRRNDSGFTDRKAEEITSRINFDYTALGKTYSEHDRISAIDRVFTMDMLCRCFLSAHPEATVVNIGAGLDSAFSRNDSGKLKWYDIDFPEVIKLRRLFYQENDRNIFLAQSVFDFSWMDKIRKDSGKGILIIAAGVMPCFLKEDAVRLVRRIGGELPGSNFLFDVFGHPLALKQANRFAEKSGNKQTPAFNWYVREKDEIKDWSETILSVRAISNFAFFDVCMKRSMKTKILNYVSGKLAAIRYCHIKYI